MQIHEDIGLNFANALRAFLRQDPDIIMVGEIRDFETAEIAIKAALTGHLVLSTLHTNDAPSTINRLLNMGVEPFLVASSVNLDPGAAPGARGLQRLQGAGRGAAAGARRASASPPTRSARSRASTAPAARSCSGTGYRGRVALYEVMPMSEELRELVLTGASATRSSAPPSPSA